jgi:fructose-1,6-bisphosphatase
MMKNLGVFFLTIALINSIIESKKDSYKSSNKHYAVSIDKSTQTKWNNKVQNYNQHQQQKQQQLKDKHKGTKIAKRIYF